MVEVAHYWKAYMCIQIYQTSEEEKCRAKLLVWLHSGDQNNIHTRTQQASVQFGTLFLKVARIDDLQEGVKSP